MGTGGDEIKQPNACLHHLPWPTSRRDIWCPDSYAWWLKLLSSGWHPPTSSRGYDTPYRGGIGSGLATQAQSHWEFSSCGFFAQQEASKLPPSCKLVIVRMQCTGRTVVQGLAEWAGIFLALWSVDGWVILWSLLERFWISFWCFISSIIASVIFMHEGLCWEFTMLGLIVEMHGFGKHIVAVIGLGVWL